MTMIWITVISFGLVLGLGEYTTVKANNTELAAQVKEQSATIDELQASAIKKNEMLHTLDGVTVQDLSTSSGALA
jgi:hypothetical protein